MEQVIQYKANDGTMFLTKEACLQYERGCKTQRHIINQYRREINQRNIVGRCMRDVDAAKKQVTSIQDLLTAHRARIYVTLSNGQREMRNDWSKDDWLAYELRIITYRHQLKTRVTVLKAHKESLKQAELILNRVSNKLHDMILKAYKDGDLDKWAVSNSSFGNDIIINLMVRFHIGPFHICPKYNK